MVQVVKLRYTSKIVLYTSLFSGILWNLHFNFFSTNLLNSFSYLDIRCTHDKKYLIHTISILRIGPLRQLR